MYYCSSCGEVGDGRFCRMCGTALSTLAGPASAEQLSAVSATQVTGPGSEYDALFRSADNGWGPADQTRALPTPGAVSGTGTGTGVGVDYRMEPPGPGGLPSYTATTTLPPQAPGQSGLHQSGMHQSAMHQSGMNQSGMQMPTQAPPHATQQMQVDGYPPPPNGYDEGWGPEGEDESEGPRKGVIYGTLGAVAVAIAVIGALLYLGTPNSGNGSNASGSQFTTTAGASGAATQGALILPSADPTTAAPTTSPAQPTTAPPSTAPPAGNSALPLSLGSTGNLVKYVQQRLEELRFYDGPANGKFDQATAAAVQQFQAAARVQGDPASVVGRSTMTALISAGSQPTIRLTGNNNPSDVKRLQEALDYAEDAGLPANGNFTMATRTAVMRYQSAVGLIPTGQVDGQTWSRLQSGTLAS